MSSKKESQLTTASGFQTGDLITGLRGGVNVNFSFSDVYNAVIGFGTLNSVGVGTPVLQQPVAGVNNYRSIESSKGVLAAVSAQNGIRIGSNFTQAGLGAKLIPDLTANQYALRSFLGGDSINVTESGSNIIINYAPSGSSLKTVTVSQMSDFPAPVGGVITLLNDTDYFLQADLSTSDRFIVGSSTTLRGPASQIVKLTYTGAGTMLTGVNPNFRVDRVTLACPNGTLLNMSSTLPTSIFQMIEANIESCNSGGTISGIFICRIKGVAWEDIKTNGVTFTGANLNLVIDTGIAFLNGGAWFDLGTATFNVISIANLIVQTSAVGTFFLKGAASSANLNVGGFGTATNNRTFGSATPLSGISHDDSRWQFLENNAIPDTRPDALISFVTPTTTVITTVNTPELITGTWTVDRESQMTATAGGRVTYNGERGATLPVTLTCGLEPLTGSNKDISIYLYKNGVKVAASKISTVVSAGGQKNQAIIWQDEWVEGDYYEAYVENNTDAIDIVVNNAIIRVN